MFKKRKETISREPKYQNDVWANRKDDYMRQKLSKKKNSLKGLKSKGKKSEEIISELEDITFKFGRGRGVV